VFLHVNLLFEIISQQHLLKVVRLREEAGWHNLVISLYPNKTKIYSSLTNSSTSSSVTHTRWRGVLL
jgi:hypothetical protein